MPIESVLGIPGVGGQSSVGIGEQNSVADGIEGVGQGLAGRVGDSNCLPARS